MKKYSAIDIFCGIGGLTHGLEKVGIPVLAGFDIDSRCEYAYNVNNNSNFHCKDISSLSSEYIKSTYWNDDKIKILVGCAPCQPFSNHQNKNRNRTEHKKWNLLKEFERLVVETQPHIVSMENVPNLKNQKIFHDFVKFLKNEKFYVSFQNVYCPDYGIPQKRRRLVLLASKFKQINLVQKTHDPSKYVTVRNTIVDLALVESGEIDPHDPLHRTTKLSKVNIDRIKQSRPNGTWEDWDEELILNCHKKESGKSYKSVYGRMSWDEPAPTITTQFYNYGTGRFGHPDQNRALTLREGAMLQTFPKSYKIYNPEIPFSISKTAVHIGNAVPVKLGEVIGETILEHLLEINYEQ